MSDEGKSLKDTGSSSSVSLKDTALHISYSKTNKLISALYMVTDVLDSEEPIKNKLRTLGVELVSDIYTVSSLSDSRISAILSLLEVGKTIEIISEMNYRILAKEFIKLRDSLQRRSYSGMWAKTNLEDFLIDETAPILSGGGHESDNSRTGKYKGHQINVRNDFSMSVKRISKDVFDSMRKERRESIIKIIKDKGGTATIKDIQSSARGVLAECGEKTLQRELVSMTKEGILEKTGEKRWSKYKLAS